MCWVSMRKAVANNKYMGATHDETKPSSYINYLDANSLLYGVAICKKLPYKKIRRQQTGCWLSEMLYHRRWQPKINICTPDLPAAFVG